jgi:hypothetical protein
MSTQRRAQDALLARAEEWQRQGDFILFDAGEAIVRDSGLVLPRLRPFDLIDGMDQVAFADFIAFNAGRIAVETAGGGWPNPVKFDLSTNAVSDFAATTAYASRAPITGTGYLQASQAAPTPTAATLGNMEFSEIPWATGAATDWDSPKSIVASNGSSYLVCAWNLVAGGTARDMSQANTTLNVTPTFAPTNP